MYGATLGMSEIYNANSMPQKIAIQSSFEIIEQAIDALDIPCVNLIADYGSSQGANSIHAIKKIIEYLRLKTKSIKDPFIIHNDLPTNDWKSLFQLLNEEKLYYGMANGRSFYEQCLPTNSLAIGYSSTAIHWLSKKPCNITNHCRVDLNRNSKEYEIFRQQAFIDYSNFLKYRSIELISGGILILIILGIDNQNKVGCANLYDILYECAQLLPMTLKELNDYTISDYYRSYEECIDENLLKKYSFQLIHSKTISIESHIYKQWKDRQITFDQYIRLTTSFIRSWSESNLEQTLMNNNRMQSDVFILLNQFWNLYEEKLREKPNMGHFFDNYIYVILKKI